MNWLINANHRKISGSKRTGGGADDLASSYSFNAYSLRSKRKRDPLPVMRLREKLMDFLKRSLYYTAELLLEKATEFELDEEITQLNKRLQRHDDVLRVLYLDMHDRERAIAYCLEDYEFDPKSASDRFIVLIRLELERIRKMEARKLRKAAKKGEKSDIDDGIKKVRFSTDIDDVRSTSAASTKVCHLFAFAIQ